MFTRDSPFNLIFPKAYVRNQHHSKFGISDSSLTISENVKTSNLSLDPLNPQKKLSNGTRLDYQDDENKKLKQYSKPLIEVPGRFRINERDLKEH